LYFVSDVIFIQFYPFVIVFTRPHKLLALNHIVFK